MKTLFSLALAVLVALPVLVIAETPTMIVPNSPGTNLVASRIISTRPVKVYAVIMLNTSASTRYLQIHETNNVPLNGAAPKIPSIPVAAGAVVMVDVGGQTGLDLDSLTIVTSSTAVTNTLASAEAMISAVLHAR